MPSIFPNPLGVLSHYWTSQGAESFLLRKVAMQNLRKLCLSGRFGDLVGTALEQFPIAAGFCASVERVQRGIVSPRNAGFGSSFLNIW